MAAMQCKTRGNSSSQGKPKVYFCCHPEDLSLYLEAVTADLLEKQNCAVWYAQDMQPELSDLEQMQLFVIPVTRRFLTTPNRALETEFPFAVAHHIPILPLMQEPGLDRLFNEICGQLQFLDKHTTDATGLSYGEKLEKFLAAVLVGDKLSAEIRSAFDAYVFLSYRKKDRLHARKLMTLIHQNDFCRDIAIWYDEYLSPGENFNASIQAALEQSSLFVLAVTPNLVNEVNYVMTTEYPMAWQEGKPIVPVELVATDRALLAEKYVGIPSPAAAQDPAALTRSLQMATKGLALRKKKSPEQDYLIGLAYLNGVDVEVDHARALELITAAAEAGLPRAATRLVSMYTNGHGVERNHATALRWQEHLVGLWEQQYRNDPTPTNLFRLADAHQELGNMHSLLLHLREAIENHRCAAQLLEDFPKCEAYPKLQRTLAVGYLLMGHFYKALEKLQEAKTCMETALPIFERLDKKSSHQTTKDLHHCLISLGDLHRELGEQKEAQSYYKRAEFLGLYNALLERDAEGSGRMLVQSRLREAEQLEAQEEFAKAEQLLLKQLPSIQNLVEETKNVQDKHMLAQVYFSLARLRRNQDDLLGAEPYYLKAAAVLSAQVKEGDAIETRGNLAQVHMRLGTLRNQLGRPSEARQAYENALALLVRLATEAEKYQTDLADCYFYLGELHRLGKRWTHGDICFQKAFELYTQLSNVKNAAQTRQGMAYCQFGLGCEHKNAKQYDRAFAYFRSALEAHKLLPPSTQRSRDIASCYEQLGVLHHLAGRREDARKYYEAAFSLRTKVAKESSGVRLQEELGLSHYYMFTVTWDRAHLDKAIEIFAMLCRVCPQEERYRQRLAMLKSQLS